MPTELKMTDLNPTHKASTNLDKVEEDLVFDLQHDLTLAKVTLKLDPQVKLTPAKVVKNFDLLAMKAEND